MAQFQFHQHITLARKYLKPKPISLVNQQIQMQYLYNRLLVANYIENSMLVCILDIQPSSESQVYRIKITYKLSDGATKGMADFATIIKNMRENIHIISTARMIAEITNCVFITPNIKNGISKCMLQIRLCHGSVHG